MIAKDPLFVEEYNNLKSKVVLNWIELFALLVVSFLITLKFLNVYWETSEAPLIISCLTSVLITGVFLYFKKYQLSITPFDKENIYKKISTEF
jgi:hypothetical protein